MLEWKYEGWDTKKKEKGLINNREEANRRYIDWRVLHSVLEDPYGFFKYNVINQGHLKIIQHCRHQKPTRKGEMKHLKFSLDRSWESWMLSDKKYIFE